MLVEILSIIFTAIASGLIASIVTARAIRKKANAEADSALYASLKQAFDTFKEIGNDSIKTLRADMDKVTTERDELRAQLNECLKEIQELRKKVETLQRAISKKDKNGKKVQKVFAVLQQDELNRIQSRQCRNFEKSNDIQTNCDEFIRDVRD